ncbi:MAG: hypothetical protein ACRDPW_05870 [Mycobacteriales bacterium]
MNDRYYIEAEFSEVPCTPDELDALTDQLMEGLLDLEEHKPEICDPSIGAALGEQRLDVYLVVDAESHEAAVRIFMTCVRSTLHGIGVATPGWDEMIHSVSLQVTNQRSAEHLTTA